LSIDNIAFSCAASLRQPHCQLHNFAPQNLVTRCGLCTMGHADAALHGRWCRQPHSSGNFARETALANTAWALASWATLTLYLQHGCAEGNHRGLLAVSSPRDLANAVWAQATIDRMMLVHGCAGAGGHTQLRSFNPQRASWPIRCGRWPYDEARTQRSWCLIERATACAMDFSASQLRQLFQSMLWQRIATPGCRLGWRSAAGNGWEGQQHKGLTHAAGCARRDPPAASCSGAISEPGRTITSSASTLRCSCQATRSCRWRWMGRPLPQQHRPCPMARRACATDLGRLAGVVSVPVTEWDNRQGTQAARLSNLGREAEAPGWQSPVACVCCMFCCQHDTRDQLHAHLSPLVACSATRPWSVCTLPCTHKAACARLFSVAIPLRDLLLLAGAHLSIFCLQLNAHGCLPLFDCYTPSKRRVSLDT
jgi:hypothetical protein